jgi:hypothetical protein
MKRSLCSALVLIAAVLSGTSALAGDAGCGLGSLVIQRNSKILQLFAMTTNATFLSQAFGITSGTSGCSASGLVQNDKQIDYFVEVNQDDLTREMAQGEGEKLSTLAALHGCQSKEAQQTFSHWTQQSYEKIFPSVSTTAPQIVLNLKTELKGSPDVARVCTGVATNMSGAQSVSK